MGEQSRDAKWQKRVCWLAFFGYLLIRGGLLLNPGHIWDLDLYKEWLVRIEQFGLSQVYRTSRMDYPPLYAYILKPLGWIYRLASGTESNPPSPVLLTALVKLPPLAFDLGIAALLWRWAQFRRKGGPRSWLISSAYLLNPAVLFDSGYWGQPDPIHTFFILGAVLTIPFGQRFWLPAARDVSASGSAGAAIWPAWVLITLAILMKPLGLPYLPLLLFFSVLLYSIRSTVFGIAAAVVTATLVFSPFLFNHEAGEVFGRVFADIGSMPFTSSNAHNLWWAFGGWRDSEVPLLGPFTATHLGLIMFGAAYLALLWKGYCLHRKQPTGILPAQVIAIAVMVGFSFFMLSTHLHENHLFAVVPLAAALLLENRLWRNFFFWLSAAVFANIALHDAFVDTPNWPFTIGGPTLFAHPPYFNRNYYVAELVAIWSSTLLNLGLYAAAMVGVFRGGRGGWLERFEDAAVQRETASDIRPV